MSLGSPEPDYIVALGDGLTGLARNHLRENGDPAELAFQAVELSEALLATLRAKDPPAQSLACEKGCTACCHLRVSLTAPEALLIVQHLRPVGAHTAERLRRHVFDLHALPDDAYFLTPIPCPFLTDNACTIYPVRPLMCRGANSIDADQCHRAIFNARAGEITGYRHQSGIFRAASLGLARGIAKAGRDATALELTAAVLAALSDGTLADRWRACASAFVDAGAELDPLKRERRF